MIRRWIIVEYDPATSAARVIKRTITRWGAEWRRLTLTKREPVDRFPPRTFDVYRRPVI